MTVDVLLENTFKKLSGEKLFTNVSKPFKIAFYYLSKI